MRRKTPYLNSVNDIYTGFTLNENKEPEPPLDRPFNLTTCIWPDDLDSKFFLIRMNNYSYQQSQHMGAPTKTVRNHNIETFSTLVSTLNDEDRFTKTELDDKSTMNFIKSMATYATDIFEKQGSRYSNLEQAIKKHLGDMTTHGTDIKFRTGIQKMDPKAVEKLMVDVVADVKHISENGLTGDFLKDQGALLQRKHRKARYKDPAATYGDVLFDTMTAMIGPHKIFDFALDITEHMNPSGYERIMNLDLGPTIRDDALDRQTRMKGIQSLVINATGKRGIQLKGMYVKKHLCDQT